MAHINTSSLAVTLASTLCCTAPKRYHETDSAFFISLPLIMLPHRITAFFSCATATSFANTAILSFAFSLSHAILPLLLRVLSAQMLMTVHPTKHAHVQIFERRHLFFSRQEHCIVFHMHFRNY